MRFCSQIFHKAGVKLPIEVVVFVPVFVLCILRHVHEKPGVFTYDVWKSTGQPSSDSLWLARLVVFITRCGQPTFTHTHTKHLTNTVKPTDVCV